MVAEGDLVGRVGTIGELVENMDGVDHAQNRIQPALRADDLVDHQIWITGLGLARPVVSMMIPSRPGFPASRLRNVRIRSPRTTQQMQPL